MNKYILLVGNPGVSYKGEGTANEIRRDIDILKIKGYKPSSMSIHHVVGSRYRWESGFITGLLIGSGLVVLGKWIYKKIKK